MNDFRTKHKNWVTTNLIKMQDLAGIIDPMLQLGSRLVPLRYQTVWEGVRQNHWFLNRLCVDLTRMIVTTMPSAPSELPRNVRAKSEPF